MHKITSVVLGLLVVFIATPAFAATISLTPTTISVKKGETVSLSVAVDPQSVKLGLVKVALSFPANLLEATAFTLASTDEWLTPPGAGNSVTDNTNGSLIKTAGYLGGFTTTKNFGTATFRAKADGVATVAVTASSVAYNAQNANALSGTQGSSAITVATPKAPVPAPVPTPAPTTPKTITTQPATEGETAEEPAEEDTVSDEEVLATQEPTDDSSQPASASLLASVGSVVSFGTGSVAVGFLISVIVLALAGYAIYAFMQRPRRKSSGKLR